MQEKNLEECINQYAAGVSAKAKMKWQTMFMKAILAGAMIAMGAGASSVAAHSISNVGVSRMAAGCIFPVGLMMVILLKAELFTGDCMVIVGVTDKRISISKCISILVIVFLGNMVGGVLIAWLTSLSGQFDYSGGLLGAYTIKVAAGKAGITFGRGVSSGILCNIMVCAAVLMAVCAKDVTGKLFCSFFMILAFVVAGFEHCVANMYYITAGLFAKMNPEYVKVATETLGVTQAQLDALDISHFLVGNLVPVTIGNIIGGMIFVALPIYFVTNAKSKEN